MFANEAIASSATAVKASEAGAEIKVTVATAALTAGVIQNHYWVPRR